MQVIEEELTALGKETIYPTAYDPTLLCPVPRSLGRDRSAIPTPLPFHGVDQWTGYECSWLNERGKPEVAIGTFSFEATTPHLIESKSFKLYLNSFNECRYSSWEEVRWTMERDLSAAAGGQAKVNLYPLDEAPQNRITSLRGICLDFLDVEISSYTPDPSLIEVGTHVVEEELHSHLLKSLCPVTGQPDWGSVAIHYRGPQINHPSLLRYIVSFRKHQGFHENCVEQIFWDVWQVARPEALTVFAHYTRRGGLDINPYRSSTPSTPTFYRNCRQ